MPDKRKFEKTYCSKPVNFSVSTFDLLEIRKTQIDGIATDLSDDGIGIKTWHPVECGLVLRFFNDIRHKIGIVKWVSKAEDTYSFGVQFV